MKFLNYCFLIVSVTVLFSCSKDEELINENDFVVTDIDGNTYKTVEIGEQTWFAENLKVTHHPDGTTIPLITDNSIWGNLEDNNFDEAFCYYNNSEVLSYGALYTFAAAKKACPSGWHLPSDEEWKQLEIYLGMSKSEADSIDFRGLGIGTILKSSSNWNGTDIYGFTALPGGIRDVHSGIFRSFGSSGLWWSSTENEDYYAYYRQLMSIPPVIRLKINKSYGLSVRCVKD